MARSPTCAGCAAHGLRLGRSRRRRQRSKRTSQLEFRPLTTFGIPRLTPGFWMLCAVAALWLAWLLTLSLRPSPWLIASSGLPILLWASWLGHNASESRRRLGGAATSWRTFLAVTWDLHAGCPRPHDRARRAVCRHARRRPTASSTSAAARRHLRPRSRRRGEFAYLQQPPAHRTPLARSGRRWCGRRSILSSPRLTALAVRSTSGRRHRMPSALA